MSQDIRLFHCDSAVLCTKLVILGSAFLLGSCADPVALHKDQERVSELLTSASREQSATLSPDAKRQLESQLIEEISNLVPGRREELLRVLEVTERNGFTIPASPESRGSTTEARASALLVALLNLRAERLNADRPPAQSSGEGAATRVQVMLVEHLRDRTARAMIIRRPDDDGRPVLLFPKDTFTAEDLEFGLMLAAQNVERRGRKLEKELWIGLHEHKTNREAHRATANSREIARMLQQSPEASINGVAHGRLLEVVASSQNAAGGSIQADSR
jgi:hypothetical protein